MKKFFLILIILPFVVFGQYSMAESTTDVSLPVELSLFKLRLVENNTVELQWVTEAEINNLGFIIYRRGDDESEFNLIGSYKFDNSLKGAGSSNAEHDYVWLDYDVYFSEVEYRLYSIDINGQQHLLAAKNIRLIMSDENTTGEFQLSVFPNPFNNSLKFKIHIAKSQSINIKVFNIQGQMVQNLGSYDLQVGVNEINWIAEYLPSNIYFILFFFNDKNIFSKKVVLLR